MRSVFARSAAALVMLASGLSIVPEPPTGPEIAERLHTMTRGHRGKYTPHQGAKEIARRKRKDGGNNG